MLPLLLAVSVVVSADTEQLTLTPHLEVLVDERGELDFDAVRASAGFERVGDGATNFGFSRATVWLRASLELPATQDVSWSLEVGLPQLDYVTVYVRSQRSGEWLAMSSGDAVPFGDRPVAHATPVFPIPEYAGRQVEIYIRIQTSGTLAIAVLLWRSDALFEHSARFNLAWGFYYAFLLALAFYNLFLYTVVRERAYLFYVGYLLSFVLFQAALSGHAYQYLWPNSPAFANVAAGTFLSVTLCMSLLFLRRMANVAEIVPRLHRPIGVIAAAILLVVPCAWIHYPTAIRAVTVGAALVLLFMPFPVVMSYLRGWKPARYLVLGIVVILPGGLLLALRYLGVLPPGNFVIDHTVQIGTALEALILSFALADRINFLTRAEADAQANLLAAEQRALVAQRDLSRRLIDAQDAERRRIAGELHDGVGQDMLVIANRIKRLDDGDGELVELANRTISELRSVAHGLHPNKLDRLGLAAAVEATVNDIADTSEISAVCHIDDVDGLLSKAAELHVYRVVQEATSNAVRHADAGEITVVLRRNGDTFELRVEDDGRGIGDAVTPGLGLAGIRERAAILGAQVRIAPGPGEGVRIELDVPIEEPAS